MNYKDDNDLMRQLFGMKTELPAHTAQRIRETCEKLEEKRTAVIFGRRFALTLRTIAAAAAAVCLVTAFGVTAFALNAFGIREMLGSNGDELEVSFIEEHGESASANGITAVLTETYCDSGTFMAALRVTGGADVLLAEADNGRFDLMENGVAIGQYADSNGMRICPVTAAIKSADSNVIVPGTELRFESSCDNEMNVLIIAHKTSDFVGKPLVCTVIVSELDENGVRNDENRSVIEIPFTVTEVEEKVIGTYSPTVADTSCGFAFGDASVAETPLGYSIRLPITVTDQNDFYDTFIECDGVSFLGGAVYDGDGSWCVYWVRGEGYIGDSFTVRCADTETGEVRSKIDFIKHLNP